MPLVIVQPGELAELSLLDRVEKPYLFGENENSLLGHMRLLPKTVFRGDAIFELAPLLRIGQSGF